MKPYSTVHPGETIIVPGGLDDLTETIERLMYLREVAIMDEKTVRLSHNIDALPLEGAFALQKALRNYGVPLQLPDDYGDRDSHELEVGVGRTVNVPWGVFQVPGISGKIRTSTWRSADLFQFRIIAEVQRSEEGKVDALVASVRTLVEEENIYRGKAFQIAFRDSTGQISSMPEIHFMDLRGIQQPIFNRDLQNNIDHRILAPIRMHQQWKANGLRFKRGILLSGKYGVGKTLLAGHIGKIAEESGISFVYIRSANELATAMDFMQKHTPCVIFVEDIDSVVDSRDDDANLILNILDGVVTKDSDIITIATTNQIAALEPALLRLERMDVILEMTDPDADTAERLIRFYAGSRLGRDTALQSVASLLANQTPANIRGTVDVALEEALIRTGHSANITEADLQAAAQTVLHQQVYVDGVLAQQKARTQEQSFALSLQHLARSNGQVD